MALPTAPCTRCRNVVVYGERQCRHCGETFNYGPSAPPAPTQAQIAEALAALSGPVAPVAPPIAQAPPPSTRPPDPMIDTGRADAVGAVATEAVPGLIDSRLFGAMVPEQVPVEAMPGIERTAQPDVSLPANDASMAAFLDTGRADTIGAVATEAVPGLIDSRLFGAMVPEHIAIEALEVDRQANAGTRGASTVSVEGGAELVHCLGCGAPREPQLAACPECGGAPTR